MATAPSSLPSYMGGDPPQCCQPAQGRCTPALRGPMTRSERLWRLRAELKARSPYVCPHCGSGAIYPSFALDRRGTYRCCGCEREFCPAD